MRYSGASLDRWWNPAVKRQAEDRVHRFGQERIVYATRLICSDTIEERIEQLLERKKILVEELVGAVGFEPTTS